jgi:hypothetical protein
VEGGLPTLIILWHPPLTHVRENSTWVLSLLDFHTFVKALAGKQFKCISGEHVIKWNFSSAKRGEYFFFLIKNMSHLFFVYP